MAYKTDSNRAEIVLYDSQTHTVHTAYYSKSISLMRMLKSSN